MKCIPLCKKTDCIAVLESDNVVTQKVGSQEASPCETKY